MLIEALMLDSVGGGHRVYQLLIGNVVQQASSLNLLIENTDKRPGELQGRHLAVYSETHIVITKTSRIKE